MSGAVIVLAGSFLAFNASALPVMELAPGAISHTGAFLFEDGAMAPVVADAQVTWTPEALEIRIRQERAPGCPLKVWGKPGEPQTIFYGATVELFLAPHPESPDVFYQIGVNPSNAVYMARKFDTNWRPARPIVTRPTVAEDSWWVDFTVPFGAFGEAPVGPGTVWKAEFSNGRFDWVGVESRQDVSQYGELRFGTRRNERAHVERVTRDTDGTMHVTYAVDPVRPSGEIPHKCGRRYDFALVSDGERLASYSTSTGYGDIGYLTLDRYYYPAGEPLSIDYVAKEFGLSEIKVRCMETDETVCSARSGGRGTLACGALAAGEYAFEVSDDKGCVSCAFEVISMGSDLPHGIAGSMRVATWNPCVLTADFGSTKGRPFYPVTGSQAFAGAISFRKACPYSAVPKPDGYLFDTSRPLYGAGDILDKGPGEGLVFNRLAYEAQLAVLTQGGPDGEVAVVPDGAGFYRSFYHALKESYPNLLFSIHTDALQEARAFVGACDVFELASWRCSYAPNPLSTIERTMDELFANAPRKPVLFWLGVSIPDNAKYRTADELNTAVRYSVLRGVSGNVFHMGHGGVPESRTRLWSFIRGVEKAVNTWYPVWARGTEADLSVVCDEGVRAAARRSGGELVLIAVNMSPFERAFSFDDSVSGSRRTVRLTGSGSIVIRRP